MKKIYLNLLVLTVFLFSAGVHATVHTVNVNASNFSPNMITVNVGDTVHWVRTGGTHTTTSTSVPPGAATWDSPISANVTFFDYVVTVAGMYNYKCTPHNFTGQIEALSTSGISAPVTKLDFKVSTLGNSSFEFSYNLSGSAMVNMTLLDITGKLVKVLASEVKPGGNLSENYYFSDLKSGIYIVQLMTENQRITRRIVIE